MRVITQHSAKICVVYVWKFFSETFTFGFGPDHERVHRPTYPCLGTPSHRAAAGRHHRSHRRHRPGVGYVVRVRTCPGGPRSLLSRLMMVVTVVGHNVVDRHQSTKRFTVGARRHRSETGRANRLLKPKSFDVTTTAFPWTFTQQF